MSGYLFECSADAKKTYLSLYTRKVIIKGTANMCVESSLLIASFIIITKSCQYNNRGINITIKDLIHIEKVELFCNNLFIFLDSSFDYFVYF